MFGYIRLEENQLKLKDLQRYREMYCAICRRMAAYSQSARAMLSFDMVFFALLSGYEGESLAPALGSRKRCFVPLRDTCQVIDYWACISIMMIWHKLDNDVKDGERWQVGMRRMICKGYAAAKLQYPEAERILRESMDEIFRLEAAKTDDPRLLTDVFSKMMVAVYRQSPKPSEDEAFITVAEQIVATATRWLYCLDFLDDLSKDEKKNQYNPILASNDRELAKTELVKTIHDCVKELQRLSIFLPYGGYNAVISNVLHDGIPNMTGIVLKKEKAYAYLPEL